MRIIGQCTSADFTSIEHLVGMLDDPKDLDVTTLTNTQRYAFLFLNEARNKKIGWNLLRDTVKTVLFWGEDDTALRIEIKLTKDQSKIDSIRKFKELWFRS